MARVRLWQSPDLPYLQRMAILMTWHVTPADDKAATTPEVIAHNALLNLDRVLGTPGGTAVVAEEGGRPVGFLLIGIQPHERTGEPQGYMADIFVEPEHRGQGIPRELQTMGEAYMRQLGLRRSLYWIHTDNRQGQRAAFDHGAKVRGLVITKTLNGAGT